MSSSVIDMPETKSEDEQFVHLKENKYTQKELETRFLEAQKTIDDLQKQVMVLQQELNQAYYYLQQQQMQQQPVQQQMMQQQNDVKSHVYSILMP